MVRLRARAGRRRMEIREVPEVPAATKSSSSQRSHSSSSRGSLKGIAAAESGGARKNRAGDEQKLPEPSPERAPPRPFLKTSFGQRLSAQCGSVFLDASTNFQDNQAAGGCARAIPLSSTSMAENLEGGGENRNFRLTGNGNSHSASGRGSSGLSEVDVKGMVLVAAAAEVPRLGGGGGASVGNGALKLWGFAPGTVPKQRAIALVGQVAVAGKQAAAELAQREASKRDGSPLGHASRAVVSSSVVKKESIAIPKLEEELLPASEELQLARKDMIAAVSASGRLSHKSLYGSGLHIKSEVDELLEGGKKETSMPKDDQLHRCSTEQMLHAVPPLSTATDSEAPTTANLSDHGNSTKRSSFKNDCGFLKLLPSKRKFSLEDHEASPTSQKPGLYMMENETGGGMRISSNSSKISRKSLLVHLSADKPKSTGGGNDVNRESTNPSKERRGACCEQFNSSGKPVVGSFMKWMIDVGKGLAKKRCFPAATEAVVPAPSAPAQQHQQSTDVSLLGSPVVAGTYNNSAAAPSVKPSEDGRPISVSPQSCQNMDCTTEPELEPKQQSVRHEENDENVSEMHTSGDEQHQATAAALKEVDGVVSRRFENNKTDHNVSNEGGNSRNATEGTTRSVGPAEEHKDVVTPTTTATTTATTGLHAKLQEIKQLQRHQHGQEQDQLHELHDEKKGVQERKQEEQADEQDERVKKSGIVPEVAVKFTSGEEASASFGMWQAASCLKGNQQQHQQQPQREPKKNEKATPSVQQRTTNTGNKTARNVVATARDGSGDGEECSQGMAEFVASMATVKSWVYNSFKCRESNITNNSSSTSTRPCSFCGLRGHAVSDCSETLECELKELERRALVLEGLSMEVRDFPCLRCLGMGHLGIQCRFSVTEAASRARENSEFRNWKLSRRASNSGANKATDNLFLCQQPSETANLVTTNSSLAEGNRKTQSPNDAPKRKDSPKENSTSFIKKAGAGLQRSAAATPASKRKAPQPSDAVPVVPKGMLAAIESLRLSRSELWRWMDSPDFNSHIRGYFLRLRFGRWEKDLGGTGYRMARIRGGIKKAGTEDKNMSVSVDLGDMECTVDSQYVSNHAFTEVELIEWWRGRWKAGKRLITETELQNKLEQRQSL